MSAVVGWFSSEDGSWLLGFCKTPHLLELPQDRVEPAHVLRVLDDPDEVYATKHAEAILLLHVPVCMT